MSLEFEISMDEGVNLIDSFFTVIYHKKLETMKRNKKNSTNTS